MKDKTTSTLASPEATVAADTATWAIDANTLECLDQQETNLTKGDEVYVASIRFRTTPGVVGSTSTAFHGGLVDIANVNTGETHAIPNAMGRVTFANVTRRSAADILAGQLPEVIGTATAVVESDLSGNNQVNNLFAEAAADVRPIIAGVVEGLSLGDLANEDALAAAFGQLAKDVDAAVRPTFLEKLALLFGGLGDPDDPIDDKLNVFVAVDDVLGPLVDDAVGNALSPSVGIGGALRPRSYTQRFSGRGATYDISFNVSK